MFFNAANSPFPSQEAMALFVVLEIVFLYVWLFLIDPGLPHRRADEYERKAHEKNVRHWEEQVKIANDVTRKVGR